VNEHKELIFPQAEFLKVSSIGNRVHDLQLREMITASDRAKSRIVFRRWKALFRQNVAKAFAPWMLKVKGQHGPAIEFGLALDEIRLEKRHSAADVAADQLRVNDPIGYKDTADWRTTTWMKIWKADSESYPFALRHSVELSDGFGLNPRLGRGNEAHFGFGIHVSFRP
jgi:hypothetical protein